VLKGDNYRFGFGINYDFTDMEAINRTLESFMHVNSDLEEAIAEDNKGNQLEIKVKACIDAMGKPIGEMTKQDRLEVIRRLQGMNAFRFQKAVPYVAEQFGRVAL